MKLSTSHQILIGLAAGIATGIFFGERVSFLNWPAKAFVDLLQITVLPYIVGSLIVGIGDNSGQNAKRLAIWGGLALLFTWALSLFLVFAAPLALPPEKGGVFFSAVPSSDTTIDWLDLYIPANPFRSLANNTVPAVVIFSILVGIALIDLPGKNRILDPMKGFNDVLSRVATLLVKLTPIGIFAVAGYAAGTMRFDEFQRLEGFFLIYIGLSLLLTFWLLPGMVSVITSIPHRKLISVFLDAVITAFVTSSVFVVLPMIAERSKQLLKEYGISQDGGTESADVLIPASFNFPHSAKILSLTFVLFAGWFAGTPVATAMYPVVASVGLLSFFGSLNSAIPFILNVLRMPTDLFQMFIVSGVVNSHFGSGAAVMHTMVIAILGSYLMYNGIRFNAGKLLRFLGISALLITGFIVGSRILLEHTLPDPRESAAILDQLKLSGGWGHLAPAKEFKTLPPLPAQAPVVGQRLDEIVKRNVIRVGYIDDALPWCFRNSRGELVGFDIGMAHAFAVQIQVNLEFVPVTRENMDDALNKGICDIVMSGIRATPVRAKSMQFSKPYAEETAAFLVRDHLRESFSSVERVQQMTAPKIAVLNIPSWIDRLQMTFPKAKITPLESISQFINAPEGKYDGMFTAWERASAWSLMHPEFAPVIPDPGMGSFPLAYSVPKYEEDLLSLINTWIDGRLSSGLIKQKLDYWVYGKGASMTREPRWSIARNLLGWWK
ncbi:cation:dicarboxylase symporter family transporter [bacterium]|nr:cation:dicarboxylase symporter family transporter [bacterium]